MPDSRLHSPVPLSIDQLRYAGLLCRWVYLDNRSCRHEFRCPCRSRRSRAGGSGSVGLSLSLALTSIQPFSVNFRALLIKFVRTCRKRVASPTSITGMLSSTFSLNCNCFSIAVFRNIPILRSRDSRTTNSSFSSSSLPASILLKSRTSSSTLRSISPDVRISLPISRIPVGNDSSSRKLADT
jgi:hypothetical protein